MHIYQVDKHMCIYFCMQMQIHWPRKIFTNWLSHNASKRRFYSGGCNATNNQITLQKKTVAQTQASKRANPHAPPPKKDKRKKSDIHIAFRDLILAFGPITRRNKWKHRRRNEIKTSLSRGRVGRGRDRGRPQRPLKPGVADKATASVKYLVLRPGAAFSISFFFYFPLPSFFSYLFLFSVFFSSLFVIYLLSFCLFASPIAFLCFCVVAVLGVL